MFARSAFGSPDFIGSLLCGAELYVQYMEATQPFWAVLWGGPKGIFTKIHLEITSQWNDNTNFEKATKNEKIHMPPRLKFIWISLPAGE